MQTRDIKSLVKEDRVHKDVFLDPGIFADEMQNVFMNTWVYVGHESEIENPGDFKRTYMGLEDVVIVRTKNMAIKVLVNLCRHRGVTLCQKDTGNIKNFFCAYHGWIYDLDGNLKGLPGEEAFPSNFNAQEYGLVGARVDTYRGFVFATFNPNAPSLMEHLGTAAKFIDYFVDLSPTGRIKLDKGVTKTSYPANWKHQVENSMDGYHPLLVHKSFMDNILRVRVKNHPTLKDVDVSKFMDHMVGFSSPSRSVALENGHALLDLRPVDRGAISGMPPTLEPAMQEWKKKLEERLGKEKAKEVLDVNGGEGFNLLIYPNLVLITVQIRVIVPKAVDATEVHYYPTSLEGVDESLNVFRMRQQEDFFGAASFGGPDDVEMFVRQKEGLAHTNAVPWILYNRGMEREEPFADNPDCRASHVTDETAHRGIWRRWIELMAGK